MNREDFGKIVSSLREDLDLTQIQLAELSDIPYPVISQIERGVKRYFDASLLVALADALQLSTYERRQFMLASTGVEIGEMVRPNLPHASSDTADSGKELEKLAKAGSALQVPAFIIDPFYDFVMVNRSMLAMFKVEQPMIDYLAQVPRGFNSVHLTFGKGLFAQSQIDWNWDQYAFNTMRGFREVSLRYRNHPYFIYLLKSFRNPEEYPFFNRFWKMTASAQEDKEANWDFLEYKDKTFGYMKYIATTTIFITYFGELYFIKYFALNENTNKIFNELANKFGTEMLQFASWPEKNYPGKTAMPKPRKR